jgi:hypothetical protein
MFYYYVFSYFIKNSEKQTIITSQEKKHPQRRTQAEMSTMARDAGWGNHNR